MRDITNIVSGGQTGFVPVKPQSVMATTAIAECTSMLDPSCIKQEPVDIGSIKQEVNPDSTTGNTPKKKGGRPKKVKQEKQEKITEHGEVKKKRKIDRFKGMSEDEVAKRLLPDHLAHDLDIVIVGINPGLYAAFVGHHYAGPGNHFWKCLYLSGLIPEPMNAMQDAKLLEYGIGFTNIVARTTRGSADLSRKEIKEGAGILKEKLLKYKPKIAVFNGKGIYEVFVGHKNFSFGKQPEPLLGTETAVYVMPSSSARCSQLPRAVDKVPFYAALKKFRDHLRGNLPDLQESEITFPDLALKTAVKKEPKVENPEEYPGEMTDPSLSNIDNQLAQFTQGSYTVTPHPVSQPPYDWQGSGGPAMSAGPDNGMVQVKQEPVDYDQSHQASNSGYSQSKTMSLGQFEVYNHTQTPAQNDSQLNNFLNGLYGMMDQVAGSSQSSRYGVVNNASFASNGPVQFNDALRNIVKESDDAESSQDLTAPHSSAPISQSYQSQVSNIPLNETGGQAAQSSNQKSGKTGKGRKRKSKTKDELMPSSAESSTGQPNQMSSASPMVSMPGDAASPSPQLSRSSSQSSLPQNPAPNSSSPSGEPLQAPQSTYSQLTPYTPQHYAGQSMFGGYPMPNSNGATGYPPMPFMPGMTTAGMTYPGYPMPGMPVTSPYSMFPPSCVPPMFTGSMSDPSAPVASFPGHGFPMSGYSTMQSAPNMVHQGDSSDSQGSQS